MKISIKIPKLPPSPPSPEAKNPFHSVKKGGAKTAPKRPKTTGTPLDIPAPPLKSRGDVSASLRQTSKKAATPKVLTPKKKPTLLKSVKRVVIKGAQKGGKA